MTVEAAQRTHNVILEPLADAEWVECVATGQPSSPLLLLERFEADAAVVLLGNRHQRKLRNGVWTETLLFDPLVESQHGLIRHGHTSVHTNALKHVGGHPPAADDDASSSGSMLVGGLPLRQTRPPRHV
jgi:hypothetical protein